jgi:hypothetical protein
MIFKEGKLNFSLSFSLNATVTYFFSSPFSMISATEMSTSSCSFLLEGVLLVITPILIPSTHSLFAVAGGCFWSHREHTVSDFALHGGDEELL